jgi:hypothetical protein
MSCMQNNQIPTESVVELKKNSNDHCFLEEFPTRMCIVIGNSYSGYLELQALKSTIASRVAVARTCSMAS